MLNFRKLLFLVSAAESAVKLNPGSVQTAKILIRLIVDVGKHGSELRKAIHGVNAEVEKIRGQIAGGAKQSEHCKSGSGSFRNTTRAERAKDKESFREPLAAINPQAHPVHISRINAGDPLIVYHLLRQRISNV